jgi:outer membrane protein OmpA-like peptidoglycan-associated protein
MRRAVMSMTLAGIFTAGIGSAVAAEDCALGQRYLGLAQERAQVYENDEAIAFLKQAVKVCPRYDAYEQLGELLAQSPDAADKQSAVNAFVAAHALATSDRAQARTLHQYASLLNREGDPANAYPLIKEAALLDPTDTEIKALEKRIQYQVEHPTQEHILRGLRDSLYQPLRLAARSSGNRPSAMPGRSTGGGGAPTVTGPSVNIPINFDTGSTRVDALTRQNVAVLAHALADPSMKGRRFVFIGHADERGDERANLALSKQRAEAIYQGVVLLEPSLEGRVDVIGRGEYEPIDPGQDERAHRTNRRLQVVSQ